VDFHASISINTSPTRRRWGASTNWYKPNGGRKWIRKAHTDPKGVCTYPREAYMNLIHECKCLGKGVHGSKKGICVFYHTMQNLTYDVKMWFKILVYFKIKMHDFGNGYIWGISAFWKLSYNWHTTFCNTHFFFHLIFSTLNHVLV
jgi:hypothetical protein